MTKYILILGPDVIYILIFRCMDNIPISWDKQICFGSLCGDDVSDGWWIVLRVMVNYLVNMIGRIMLIDGVWVMLMKWGADDHVEDFDVLRSEKNSA